MAMHDWQKLGVNYICRNCEFMRLTKNYWRTTKGSEYVEKEPKCLTE